MKSEFSTTYKTQKSVKTGRDRYPTSHISNNENWIGPDRTPTLIHLNLDKSNRPDPENVMGSSPKRKLKIHEFSARLQHLDQHVHTGFLPTTRESFEPSPERFTSFTTKNSTKTTRPIFSNVAKVNSMDQPTLLKQQKHEILSTKATSPKVKKVMKLRPVESVQSEAAAFNHCQDLRRFSQPNQISQISHINRINAVVPVPVINLDERLEEKEPKAKLNVNVNVKANLFDKRPSMIPSPSAHSNNINYLARPGTDSGLSLRNLNIPKMKGCVGKEENSKGAQYERDEEIRINSPLKQVGEESPSRYEESPPIKVNLVRALKKKPRNDTKAAREGTDADQKKSERRDITEFKLAEQSHERLDTFEDDIDLSCSLKKGSYSKMLDIAIKKPNWTPLAMKKLVDSNKESLDAKSGSEELSPRFSSRLEDMKVFKEVLGFLDLTTMCQMMRVCKKFRSNGHLRLLRKAQCKLIIQGLSEEDQYGFWDFHVNFDSIQKAFPLQYTMNEMKPSKFERDILSDIDRTHVFNDFLGSRQNSLFKVLIAFSNAVPKIGYIQGLNSIAAVFLSHRISESEAYWLMKYAFKRKRLDEVLADGFSKVQLLTYQLEIYMRNYVPDIIDHLGENGINISYFTTQWFITMFSYDLELSHLTKIWNLFFIKGWKILIRVALTILWHFQADICKQQSDDLPYFLKTFVRERIAQISEEEFFGVALSFKVSNRLLKCLETLYEHSGPVNVILVSNGEGKLEWKILPDDCSLMDISLATPIDVMDYLNENIDQIRNLNKMKGDVHNELDNYRSIHQDTINTSLTLDNISFECRSSTNSLPNSQASRSFDQTFIQTLSNFGKKLKQMLTPKDGNQDPMFHQKKLTNAKVLDFTNDKDAIESYTNLTDRSIHRPTTALNRGNSKLLVSSDAVDAPFKRSIIGALRDSNDKLGINLFDPLNFSGHRDRDSSRHIAQASKATTASTNDALEQIERDILTMETKSNNQRCNSSFNQELFGKNFRKSRTICLDKVLDEKSEEEGLPMTRHTEYTPSNQLRKSQSDGNRNCLTSSSRRVSLHEGSPWLPQEESGERVKTAGSQRDFGWDAGDRYNRQFEIGVGMIIPEETNC